MAREQRKLAAILAADVVGFSRLIGRDESGTLARLKAHRTERLEPTLARHGGRLVKLTGDGALAEFPSAVDAVSAAIEFQQLMADENQDQHEDTRIVFRIGLHLGDLIVDGDDLYGDGVNVAALAFYYKALEADPNFALAFAYASVCYAQRKAWGWRIADPSDAVIEAERLARRALELDRSDPRVLAYAGWTTSFLCQRIEEGAALIAAAVERDPNLFYAWNYRGWTSLFLGDNRGIEHFRHALRLSPLHPSLFGIYGGMAASHFLLEDYEQTVFWGAKVLAEYPKQISTLWFVAAALGLAGRLDEARAACETIRSVIPTVRLSNLKTWMTVARDDLLDELKEGLRLAGMPE